MGLFEASVDSLVCSFWYDFSYESDSLCLCSFESVGFSLRSAGKFVDCCGKRRFLLGLPSCPAKVPLCFALCFSPCHLPALYLPWTLFSTVTASRWKKIDEPRSAFAVSVASLTQTYFKISERNRGFKDEMFALRMHRGKILRSRAMLEQHPGRHMSKKTPPMTFS